MKNITDGEFDDFLDDATHHVADMWSKSSGETLTIDQLYKLNDLLTQHFYHMR